MTIRCGKVPFRGNVASSAKVPSSAKGAFHDSLGFQPQVTIAPHSPALKARPMIQRCTPMFPTPVISSDLQPNRPFMERAVGASGGWESRFPGVETPGCHVTRRWR